mmetsp:Transcript_36695/g.113106  ORF Transcript_36695/g.113106 Transcript_36695/m.113106 type:complete len:236 (-) Transcript_36695:383-1090(-)
MGTVQDAVGLGLTAGRFNAQVAKICGRAKSLLNEIGPFSGLCHRASVKIGRKMRLVLAQACLDTLKWRDAALELLGAVLLDGRDLEVAMHDVLRVHEVDHHLGQSQGKMMAGATEVQSNQVRENGLLVTALLLVGPFFQRNFRSEGRRDVLVDLARRVELRCGGQNDHPELDRRVFLAEDVSGALGQEIEEVRKETGAVIDLPEDEKEGSVVVLETLRILQLLDPRGIDAELEQY